MDINHLKVFLKINDTRNFSEAARQIGMNQPTISRHLSDLEKELGSQLFVRDRRNVSLSRAGNLFLPYAEQIVELAGQAEEVVKRLSAEASDRISICTLVTSNDVLSQSLLSFFEQYPDVVVDTKVVTGQEQVKIFAENDADIFFTVKEMIPVGGMFDWVTTMTDRLCLVVPKSHPYADQPLDFSNYKEDRFIAVAEDERPYLGNLVKKICEARGYVPNVRAQYSRVEDIVRSVQDGLGISIVPRALRRITFSENVIFIPIPEDDARREYVLAWYRDYSGNPGVRNFLKVVRPIFEKGRRTAL